jgi:hypothetical protein
MVWKLTVTGSARQVKLTYRMRDTANVPTPSRRRSGWYVTFSGKKVFFRMAESPDKQKAVLMSTSLTVTSVGLIKAQKIAIVKLQEVYL